MIVTDPKVAGKCIKEGGIVVFPTETVYGIGASAYDEAACCKIYDLKRRPADNPLIIHLASPEDIEKVAVVRQEHVPLFFHFLPGSITFVLKKKDPALFTSGLPTVAVRVPLLEITRQMIEAAGVPVAAPSANISGKPSITRLSDAIEQFEGRVDAILRGPDCLVGVESSVVNLSQETPYYLRPGAIPFEEVIPFLPNLIRAPSSPAQQPISPGLKYKHYAPACQVILLDDMTNVTELNSGQIGFHLVKSGQLNVTVANNEKYLQRLYAFFIDCDKLGVNTAYCERPKGDKFEETLLHRIHKAMTK